MSQISLLAWSITERKPNVRVSGETENAAQRKIHKTVKILGLQKSSNEGDNDGYIERKKIW
jgi:hypothetical protein